MPKNCYFCQNKNVEIDYKNVELLSKFISAQAKISNPKRSGTCATHQRKLAKAIKRSRTLGLLPFVRR